MECLGQDEEGKDIWVYTQDNGIEVVYRDANDDGVPDEMWFTTTPSDPTDPTTPLDPPTPPDPCSEPGADPCECNGDCPPDIPNDPLPKDCAGVEGGNAYLDDCQVCIDGIKNKVPCVPKIPCEEVKSIIANPQIKAQYDALITKIKSGVSSEWGSEIFSKFGNLDDWLHYKGNHDFISPNVREGADHNFKPNWRDDPALLYRMEGYLHIHPTDGTCFSPADVETFLELKFDYFNIEARSADAIAIAITPSTTFTLIVGDWKGLRDFDTNILSDLNNEFIRRINNFENQEKIFMDLYIDNPELKGALQLFKTDSNGNNEQVTLDANKNTKYQPCK